MPVANIVLFFNVNALVFNVLTLLILLLESNIIALFASALPSTILVKYGLLLSPPPVLSTIPVIFSPFTVKELHEIAPILDILLLELVTRALLELAVPGVTFK